MQFNRTIKKFERNGADGSFVEGRIFLNKLEKNMENMEMTQFELVSIKQLEKNLVETKSFFDSLCAQLIIVIFCALLYDWVSATFVTM